MAAPGRKADNLGDFLEIYMESRGGISHTVHNSCKVTAVQPYSEQIFTVWENTTTKPLCAGFFVCLSPTSICLSVFYL
jgi:hypothetical protein